MSKSVRFAPFTVLALAAAALGPAASPNQSSAGSMARRALTLATVEEVNEYVNNEMDHRFPDIFRFGRPLVVNRVL